MMSSIHHGAAPQRARVAALRNGRGERIGRFGLDETTRRCHRWEWLEHRWPDTAFSMVPDPDEALPADALSEVYGLPPEIHPLGCAVWAELHRIRRIYEVFRVDGVRRRIAVLVVEESALNWLDVNEGGIVELAPGWLTFEPRAHLELSSQLSRRLVQHVTQSPTRDRWSAHVDDDAVDLSWQGASARVACSGLC